jgi:hypothetical protein
VLGYFTDPQLGEGLQILETMGDCDEVRQLTAALTSKVRGFQSSSDPNYGGSSLNGIQSWQHSEVMQDFMNTLEQETLVADKVAIGAPTYTFTAPGSEPFLPGEGLGFADKTWWKGFRNQEVPSGENMGPQVRAPGAELEAHLDMPFDAANAFFFPPLPIVSSLASRQAY